MGALAAVALVVRLAGAGTDSRASVLLVGYAVGSVLAAGLALAMYLSGDDLRRIVAFLLGSFADCDVAPGGDRAARHPHGHAAHRESERARSTRCCWATRRPRTWASTCVASDASCWGSSALVTAVAVALAGLIGFVGLVVPHVVRLVSGPSARSVLPLSALFGAVFMVVADLVARIPGELPVGIVTALVGVPVFLVLLRRARGAYEL